MAILLPFVIIAILILINGLFVAAEFSIIGVRPSRVQQLASQGNRPAQWVETVLDNRRKTDRYIATAQLGITLASLGLGMYAEPAIAHFIEAPLHDWFALEGTIVHTISFVISLTLITYLHVVFGEMVPKSLALQSAERMVLVLTAPMRLVGKLFSIPVTLLNRIGLVTLRLLRIPPPGEDSRLYSLDELELIVEESHAGGLLQADQQVLIANILDLAQARVDQIMAPRTQMDAIPITTSEEEMLALVTGTSHSRLPVYAESMDDIVGVVHLKDFIRQQLAEQPFDLQALLRPVLFVPESLSVKTLLANLQRQHQHIAIVMDEHGGTLGLVTQEDLLEEVVGEVRDEFDVDEEDAVTPIGPGHLLAQGGARLEEVAKYVNLGAPRHDVHTLGGLVWVELGRKPEVGDQVFAGDATIQVQDVDGLAVERVSIHFSSQE